MIRWAGIWLGILLVYLGYTGRYRAFWLALVGFREVPEAGKGKGSGDGGSGFN